MKAKTSVKVSGWIGQMSLGLVIQLLVWTAAQAQQKDNMVFNLLIGTYTSPGKSEGIYVYRFDTETGAATYHSKAAGIANPSYLAVTGNEKFVYSVSEEGKGKGSISAFSFDALAGKLEPLNSVSSGGDGPCYVSVTDKNSYVFSGNYSGGSLSAIPVNSDGSLNANAQVIQHETVTDSKNKKQQPHVHATVLSPDNRFLYTPDLGLDKIFIYRFNADQSKPLTPAVPAFVKLKAGSGPRHLTFHPNGKYAYLIQELGCLITAFDYKNGNLVAKQTVNILPAGYKGPMEAADIHVSPDGKFLYGSNREDVNEIVIYAIGNDGKLTFAGRQSTLGKAPRNFVIDPTGNYLLAANQNTDNIIVFKRDKKTGLLTNTNKTIALGMPVCLKFAAIK